MPESRPGSMISKQWIKETRCSFLDFLRTPHFPECTQLQGRGSPGVYPEWLIRLIGVVAGKCKEKTDVGIHRLRTRYWQERCGQEVQAPPLAARP